MFGASLVDLEAKNVYRAVYGDDLTREVVCRVDAHAYGTLHDKYGFIRVSEKNSSRKLTEQTLLLRSPV